MVILSQNMASDRSKKVVFIIVDGISFDQLKTVSTPNLDRIGLEGDFTESYVGGVAGTYAETPTISAVGYNSLLTGAWANKHNVYGNEIKNPNYNYPSIFNLYKDYNPNGTIAVFSSWLDNRTKLVGDGLNETDRIKVDFYFDGLEHDSINYPHDKKRNFMKLIDLNVALKASETILKEGPDVSWVYLEFTDDMGHTYGDSPYFNAAIAFEDDLIGRIYDSVIKRQQGNDHEDWLFIVTTDHGRSAKNGKGHGGQTPRERSTWMVTNLKNTNAYFKEETPAIVDILPTMIDFMHIEVPQNIKREFDGVSLISPVDATNLKASVKESNLTVTWKNHSASNIKANIYISTDNHFKSGKEDVYTLLGEADLSKEAFEVSLKDLKSEFYKVVLESKNTNLNYWITK
ncbi:MAG: alkaline phosphatase family protein [Bacteroidetes bacterium]|nr:alkaline phosphatase family protein [Bacteroidota bacterium]